MTEHTPTPWRVEEGTDLIWGACNPDDRSTYGMGYSIVEGESGSWGNRKPDMDEREANAAFIVKAVNNHELLIAALKEADKALEALGVENIHRVRWNVIRFALSQSGVDVSGSQGTAP